MLREYEFTLLARADLSEADRHKVFQTYEEILGREGGQILTKDDWGTKRLAYPIKKHFKGHYCFYNFATTPANLTEAERLLRIDENVLRFMVVKTADEVDVEARKAELTKKAATVREEVEV